MKIVTVGKGYVDLVTGTCLFEVGTDVVSINVNHERVGSFKTGASVNDFLDPGRIVIGSEYHNARNLPQQQYNPFTLNAIDTKKINHFG